MFGSAAKRNEVWEGIPGAARCCSLPPLLPKIVRADLLAAPLRPRLEEVESRLAPSANVPITTDPGVQQMPSIEVDPRNASHLVTAYMDYSLLTTGYAGIGVAVSENGGATWEHTSIPLPAPFDQGAATPTVAFSAQGQVFVSFAAATFLGQLPPITDPNGGAPGRWASSPTTASSWPRATTAD